jgi:hypothetical protein
MSKRLRWIYPPIFIPKTTCHQAYVMSGPLVWTYMYLFPPHLLSIHLMHPSISKNEEPQAYEREGKGTQRKAKIAKTWRHVLLCLKGSTNMCCLCSPFSSLLNTYSKSTTHKSHVPYWKSSMDLYKPLPFRSLLYTHTTLLSCNKFKQFDSMERRVARI